MNREILPFLSGTLRGVISELAKVDNPIAKHIIEVDSIIESAFSIRSLLSDKLKPLICTKVIDSYLTGEVNMLSVRLGEDDANISFLPKDKEPEYTIDGTWARKNRQEGKPAKIFQKALVKEFKQQEWEVFSNAFKAEICSCNNFELVSGEDIRHWYCENYYYECKGTLGNSCMRYENAQDYFDVYVDKAKMLITKKFGKLTGRAIVWEIDENITLLDRVYTCYDYLYNCFIDYAKEHKWYIRQDNSLLHTGDQQEWLTPDDDYTHSQFIPFTIHLDKRYEYFPYLDSFRYYNDDGNYITTVIDDVALDSTEGEWDRQSICCEHCGRVFYGYGDDDLPDELHWSDWSECYLCDDCCYWCELLEDYIPNSVEHVTIYDTIDQVYKDYLPEPELSEYLITDPSELRNGGENQIVKIGEKYYFYESSTVIFNLDSNEFELIHKNEQPCNNVNINPSNLFISDCF